MGKNQHDADVLRGMIRGPWADLWATAEEENGESFSGMDIYPLAPEAPGWAKKWGKLLAKVIVKANHASLGALYEAAKAEGYQYDAEQFGVHLGMQSVGHGISWTDDVRSPRLKILLPQTEFYEHVSSVDERFIHQS